jgi:hypothetical protein
VTEESHGAAFRADFKLPFTVSNLYEGQGAPSPNPFAPVPQLALGLEIGRFGFGLGFGFTSVSATLPASEAGISTTITELMIAPTLTYDVFRSNDNKVGFYLLGAPIFGDVIITNEASLSDIGFQFALGAHVALHENFHVGLEAGPVGHFYSGSSNTTSLSTVSLYTALVGTFVYPR